MRRQFTARASQDTVRRAVVTATALSASGLATGPGHADSGEAGQMDGATWVPYGRFDLTPFSDFTFSNRPRTAE